MVSLLGTPPFIFNDVILTQAGLLDIGPLQLTDDFYYCGALEGMASVAFLFAEGACYRVSTELVGARAMTSFSASRANLLARAGSRNIAKILAVKTALWEKDKFLDGVPLQVNFRRVFHGVVQILAG